MKDLTVVIKSVITEKKDIFYSILFGFLAGITTVGLFAASGYLISKAALIPPFYTLIILTSTVKLLGITKALARYLERYYSHRATFTMLSHLRVSFFQKLEPLAPGIFQNYRSGDLLARIVGDVETLQNFFLRVFYPPIVLVTVFVSTILFTAFFSVYVALVLLLGLLLTGFVVPALFTLRQAKIDRHVRAGRGDLSTDITEFLYGFRDLKIYQKIDDKEQKLIQTSDTYINEQTHENINKLYSQSVNTFISLFVSWIVLTLGAYLSINGQMDAIFLAMLVMISLTVFEDAAPMAIFPMHLHDNMHASSRLAAVVEDKHHTSQKVTSPAMKDLPENKAPSVKLEDVTFSFPNQSRQTLKNLNLSLPAGSKTAIVGPSGSGKSVLLQLLLKMNPIDDGHIDIDGTPLSQIRDEAIWEHSKVVLQDNHFFFGTVKDNLLLASDHLKDTEMNAALSDVGLGHFNLSAPIYEKAANLSGGEKQRLAIARALLKKGTFWLLDEPTSSVDAITEQAIYARLFEQAEHDTLVLVSHNLTNLENMDQIIAMDHGTIIESGTFEELIAQQGYLYHMKQIEKNLL